MSNEVTFSNSRNRWEGDPVEGDCDFLGCYDTVNRGPSYQCSEPDCECGLFFCYYHQGYIHNENTAEAKADTIEFLKIILESEAWEGIRRAIPHKVKEYQELVYND